MSALYQRIIQILEAGVMNEKDEDFIRSSEPRTLEEQDAVLTLTCALHFGRVKKISESDANDRGFALAGW
jgi:hypothetical protein